MISFQCKEGNQQMNIFRQKILLFFLLVTPEAFITAGSPVDKNTTFYASFDKSAREADYALGWKGFNGSGATLTEGVKGKAIDIRMRPIMKDFKNKCDDYTPTYVSWGFEGKGNIKTKQGTFECWFQVTDLSKDKRNIFGNNFLCAPVSRNLKIKPEKSSKNQFPNYTNIGLTINQYFMKFWFSFLNEDSIVEQINFKDVKGFGKYLQPGEWHYFTMSWSPGELVVYLDGRPVKAWDMSGKIGFILFASPVRFLTMSDFVLDELRISDIVRYKKNFEPEWPGGKRPAYAFTGNPDVKRFPGKYAKITVPEPKKAVSGPEMSIKLGEMKLNFNRDTGALVQLDRSTLKYANGLLLWQGLERQPLDTSTASNWQKKPGKISFSQNFASVNADNCLTAGKQGVVDWTIELKNTGSKEIWLETLLSIPLAMQVKEFFDGSEVKTALQLPRHRDLYKSTLPYVAASDGKNFIGVGLHPGKLYSDLVAQWLPESTGQAEIRQGIKLALSPGEKFTLHYKLIKGNGEFGCKEAVDTFHQEYPQYYRFIKDVPVYSYMPATQYVVADKFYDLKRQGYAGCFWGHGPGHDKGDDFGSKRFWNRKEFGKWPSWHRYTNRLEKLWGSPENIHMFVPAYYKRSYDSWYPVRRYHACPDVFAAYYLEELQPGCKPNDDLLCFGQYYLGTYNWYMINEYNTPAGAHILDQAKKYYNAMKPWSPGFINDMSHAGCLYRHNDEIAKKTPGRSFSPDLGTFIRKAFGRKARYEVINNEIDNRGFRSSFWSDGGAFSYTLCAYSSALAIEGAGQLKDLMQNGRYIEASRYLLGEKPLTAMTHLNDDWSGYFIDNPTPELLREYYRYGMRQLMLFCMKNGVTFDPSSYNNGRQFMHEYNPALVESTIMGCRLVDGVKVDSPLWVRRSGKGISQMLIVGNEKPKELTTDVTCFNRYFTGKPVFGNWLGGLLEQTAGPNKSIIKNVKVPARTPIIFKQLGLLKGSGAGNIKVDFTGDGIDMEIVFAISIDKPEIFEMNTFGPMYQITGLNLNGKKQAAVSTLKLSPGKNVVSLKLHNQALDFSADTWKKVDLIKNNKTNFYLIADQGEYQTIGNGKGGSLSQQKFRYGFEYGTAMMLSDFVHQYDTEDGIPDNLALPAFSSSHKKDYPGWAVEFKINPQLQFGKTTIDQKKRLITVSGATQGEIRRAMVVFMRLVDRKYPHIGRFVPMRYRKAQYQPGKPVAFKKLCLRVKTRTMYEKLSDPLFQYKPILKPEYDNLYKNGNMDFAGKYMLAHSPYIFEPTYNDDFVYGYKGAKTELLKFDKDGNLIK